MGGSRDSCGSWPEDWLSSGSGGLGGNGSAEGSGDGLEGFGVELAQRVEAAPGELAGDRQRRPGVREPARLERQVVGPVGTRGPASVGSEVSSRTLPNYDPQGPGDDLGTRRVFAEDLRDAKTGEAVGQHNGTCTLFRVPQVWLCHAGWTMKHVGRGGKTGTLVAGGLLDRSGSVKPPFYVAIFGGTGDFDNVRGEIAVRPLERADIAYDLQLVR